MMGWYSTGATNSLFGWGVVIVGPAQIAVAGIEVGKKPSTQLFATARRIEIRQTDLLAESTAAFAYPRR